MEKAWLQAWADLPQAKIQSWIERIPRHIQEIIHLKGGNEYPEGRKAFKRDFAGLRLKGKLSSHAYLHPQGKQDNEQEQKQEQDIWQDQDNEQGTRPREGNEQ